MISLLSTLALSILLLASMLFLAVRETKNRRRIDEMLAAQRSFEASIIEAESRLKASEDAKASLEKTFSAMKDAVAKQERLIEDLKTAMNMDSFDGRFPICSNCKDIRDEKGCWHSIEEFIAHMSEAEFSHSLCPDCARKLYPDMFEDGKKLHTLTWK